MAGLIATLRMAGRSPKKASQVDDESRVGPDRSGS